MWLTKSITYIALDDTVFSSVQDVCGLLKHASRLVHHSQEHLVIKFCQLVHHLLNQLKVPTLCPLSLLTGAAGFFLLTLIHVALRSSWTSRRWTCWWSSPRGRSECAAPGLTPTSCWRSRPSSMETGLSASRLLLELRLCFVDNCSKLTENPLQLLGEWLEEDGLLQLYSSPSQPSIELRRVALSCLANICFR